MKCDADGHPLPINAKPFPHPGRSNNNWDPYKDQLQFETADLLFRQTKSSASSVDKVLKLWDESLKPYGGSAPFKDHRDLHRMIDSTPLADAPWQSCKFYYQGDKPIEDVPAWMDAEYDIWFRSPRSLVQDIISNPDFATEFDYAPYQEYHGEDHRFGDFMSGDWAWKQAVRFSSSFLV